MSERRLTPNQKCALELVRKRESAQCISGPTWADPYTAFIHYRTAESLRAKGLIAIGPGPDYDITLWAETCQFGRYDEDGNPIEECERTDYEEVDMGDGTVRLCPKHRRWGPALGRECR